LLVVDQLISHQATGLLAPHWETDTLLGYWKSCVFDLPKTSDENGARQKDYVYQHYFTPKRYGRRIYY